MKRTKSQSTSKVDESDEPPPKKVRKVKPAPPPKVEPVLGSLPLYGEALPDGGYDSIPAVAKKACAGLRDVLKKIRAIKEDAANSKVGSGCHLRAVPTC